ncbi:acyltransferase [Halomonas sp. SH5A2]|uniref:acyltransferase family protein n=1 Tax=Halomonas sp. SH5A2 TaxID=2749040 RepID=UPI001641A454|nr:acyltransferase family protein [Halomonas sp. SH5A2]QNI02388.1 acyltransferase [Halomonas sp. SH5A2]
MRKSEYRPDIDGLRTVAVMSVLLFHAGFSSFSGGFIGVDVFFVISGYLITMIIKEEVERTGHFSFSNFYVRRIRRLLPALLFTLVASLLLGVFLFSPQHLERLGKSTITALFSVSNFFFWSESGYFDTASDLKPLLHTWSLSVEEQFYLVWPLLIWLSIRYLGKYAPWSIATLGGFSLLGAVIMLGHDASGAYFLTPVRAYEFAIGAVLVWVCQYRLRSNVLMELLLLAGLSMVLIPVFIFDENTAFPGVAALAPCLGTAMAIYAGQARFAGIILRNPVAVKIGLISYSLYLAHWPIYVFYKYYVFRDLVPVEKFGVVFTSILVGWAMYKFIEIPFRKTRGHHAPKRKVFASYAVAAASLAAPSAMISANHGLEWRLPDEIRKAISELPEKNSETWVHVQGPEAPANQDFFSDERVKVLIVGDSHSKDTYNALYLDGYLRDIADIRRSEMDEACLHIFSSLNSSDSESADPRCRNMASSLVSSDNFSNAEVVVFSTRWSWSTIKYISDFSEFLEEHTDAKLVLLGRSQEFKDVPDLIVRHGRLSGADKLLYDNRIETIDRLNDKVEDISKEVGAGYIDKQKLSCDFSARKCPAFDDNGNIIYYDYSHYTIPGARFIGGKMRREDFLTEFL